MIKDVTDLEVYKESLRLLPILYSLLEKMPKLEYDTVLQCKRAAKSIPANITEGFAKRSSALEFKRFLRIALGSSDEMVTHCRIITITVPKLKDEANGLLSEYTLLSRRINKLCSIWQKGIASDL